MNDKSTTQLKEVLVAIASIWKDAVEAKKDGTITKLEVVKMVLANLGLAAAAFSGIGEVWDEIKDLEADELDPIYDAVLKEVEWPEHSTNRDVMNLFHNTLYHVLNNLRILDRTINPPRAVVVPERFTMPDPP